MAGDWTSQKYLGSMEGAVFAGKLAAEVVARRAKNLTNQSLKEVQPHIIAAASKHKSKRLRLTVNQI